MSKELSRRDFLKGAAATAVSAAFLGVTGAAAPKAKAAASYIPGLYVIGNDMGGFFSNSYPQMFGGTAHGKTVCFARLATLHAVTGSVYES